MARNGTGSMVLVAGNPVVTGTVISSTVNNTTMADIANEITNSLPRDGQAPPTANLPMGGYKLTGLANGVAASDSAAFGQIAAALVPYTTTAALTSTTEGSGIDLIGGAIKRVSSFSALLALTPTTITTTLGVAVDSYYGDGAAGGGVFQWAGGSTATEDLGTVACPTARTMAVASETIFTGNGATVTFTGTLAHAPIRPGSVTFTAGAITATDNSGGLLTGTGVTAGTINYTTGAWSITYSAAPANALVATAAYRYASSAGRWLRVYTGARSVSFYGFGPSAAANLSAYNAAHNAVVLSGVPGDIEIPSGSFPFASGITVNVSFVLVRCLGTKLDFSAVTSGIAVSYVGSGTGSPYNQATRGLIGCEVVGNGIGGTVVGFDFNAATEAGPSHITIEKTVVHAFGVGHRYRNNSYVINAFGADVYGCGSAIQQPSGITNGGERVTYLGATIFNNTLGVDMQNVNGDFTLIGTSLDFNSVQVNASGGRVLLSQCHVEANTYASEPFVTSGATGATIVMLGGWFLCDGANTTAIANSNTTALKGGGIFFRDVFMSNLTNNPYFATGTGNIEVSNPITYDNASNFSQLLRLDQSTLIDGGFEQATVIDAFIAADTAAITSRVTGTNIQLAIAAVNPRTGAQSLKVTKVGAGGSAAAFAIAVPLKAGKRYAGFRGWYTKVGAQTGTMFVTYEWAGINQGSVPTIARTGTSGLITVNFTAATVPYTALGPAGFDLGKAPAWATHLVVFVNLVSMAAGDLYFDDFEGYEW